MNSILRSYGAWGTLRLIVQIITTRIFFPGARLIRTPVHIRGRRHINLGSGLTTGVGVRLDAFPENDAVVMHFGENVQLNDHVHIAAVREVRIGNNVLMASRIFISDHNHGDFNTTDPEHDPETAPGLRPLASKPVIIHDNVWIGENVSILPGVTVGFGSVIGAGSVVTKDVPDRTVVAGNPARALRRYTDGQWRRI
jgi:lipopolysaccharide O-acetyltransferase